MDDAPNKANQRIEDVLAERIRTSEMGVFFQEEDLVPVVRRAIEAAFLTPGPQGKTNVNLVALAKEVFEKDIREALMPILNEVMKTDDYKKFVYETALKMAPGVMMGLFENNVANTMMHQLRDGFHDYVMGEAVQRLKSQGRF